MPDKCARPGCGKRLSLQPVSFGDREHGHHTLQCPVHKEKYTLSKDELIALLVGAVKEAIRVCPHNRMMGSDGPWCPHCDEKERCPYLPALAAVEEGEKGVTNGMD